MIEDPFSRRWWAAVLFLLAVLNTVSVALGQPDPQHVRFTALLVVLLLVGSAYNWLDHRHRERMEELRPDDED